MVAVSETAIVDIYCPLMLFLTLREKEAHES
jgi:hypothetical protein